MSLKDSTLDSKDTQRHQLTQSDKDFIVQCVAKVRSNADVFFKGGNIDTDQDLSLQPFEDILTIPIYNFLTQMWATTRSGCTPYAPWRVRWGTGNAAGKRRRALFWADGVGVNYIDGFGFNNLYFAWSMKHALGLDCILCIDAESNANPTSTLDAWSWLAGGCRSGDCLFFFITAHGNNSTAGPFDTSTLKRWCENLPAGVNILISTGACDVAYLAECKLHYTTDVDNKINSPANTGDDFKLLPYGPCPTTSTKMVANVLTLTEHHLGVLAGASGPLHIYTIIPAWFERGWSANLLTYLWTKAVGADSGSGFRRDMTWRQMVLAFTEEYTNGSNTFHPVIGMSDERFLDQRNFLFP